MNVVQAHKQKKCVYCTPFVNDAGCWRSTTFAWLEYIILACADVLHCNAKKKENFIPNQKKTQATVQLASISSHERLSNHYNYFIWMCSPNNE